MSINRSGHASIASFMSLSSFRVVLLFSSYLGHSMKRCVVVSVCEHAGQLGESDIQADCLIWRESKLQYLSHFSSDLKNKTSFGNRKNISFFVVNIFRVFGHLNFSKFAQKLAKSLIFKQFFWKKRIHSLCYLILNDV